jgi:hypothetical protein
MERIEPIGTDRTVSPVGLTRLTPVEREQERQRREQERERRRRREAAQTSPEPPEEGRSGIDVRV